MLTCANLFGGFPVSETSDESEGISAAIKAKLLVQNPYRPPLELLVHFPAGLPAGFQLHCAHLPIPGPASGRAKRGCPPPQTRSD